MARVAVHFDGVSRGAVRAAKQTEAGIDGVGRAASRNERKVASFASSTRRSLLAVGGVLGRATAVGGGVAAGGLIGAIAFAGFKFDDLKQKSTIAFTTMLGSGKKAEAFLKQLTGFAAKTPFELPGLIKSSQQLLAFGFDAKSIIPTLTAVGNAVAGMGGDPAAMESTIRAIGQIQSKGRLMAEEMMQLNEAGTFSWRALASAIGTSVPKAMALVQKGAVSADAFLAAFAENSNKRFAGMMDKQSKTFSGLLSTLKDKFREISGTVMQPFFDLAVRGMERLSEITAKPEFTAGVQRLARWLENHVVPALERMVSWIVDNRGKIADAFKNAADFAVGFAKAIGQVSTALGKLVGVLGGWENAAQLAFGALMVKKIVGMTAALGFASGGAKGAGLLGSLRALTASAWPIQLAITVTGGALAMKALGRWLGENVVDRIDGGGDKGRFVPGRGWVDDGPAATSNPRNRNTRGAGAPGSAQLTPGIGWKGTHETDGLGWGTKTAVDIMAKPGTTIGAPEAGVVTSYNPTGAQGGGSMTFAADSGVTYWLGHIAQGAKPGTRAKRGDIIAVVSGDHAAPHLHIDKTGSKVDVPSGGGYDFGNASDLLTDGTASGSGSAPRKADPNEAFRARRGLAAISQALANIRNAKVRGQLGKRVRLITADLAGADTDEELSAVTKRVENLKDRLADVLGTQSAKQKAAAEKLRAQMKESVRRALEAAVAEVKRRRDVYAAAFGTVADKALSVFDAKTRQLVSRARVNLFGLSFGAGDETPAERALRDLRSSRAAAELAKSRAEALANATPEEAAALRAQYALDDQETALEQQAQAERQAADDALDAERRRIEDEREALKERFSARLAEIKAGFENETLSAKQAQEQLLAALAAYDVKFADVGALLGSAFAAGFQSSAGAADAAAALANGGIGGPATPGSVSAGMYYTRHFAKGGKVPGVYIGRDSVPSMLSPGETVIDRSTTAALERYLASGGGGGITIVVSGNTLLGSDSAMAAELARRVEPELRRLISYQADR